MEYEKDDFTFRIEGLMQYDKFNSLSNEEHDSPQRLRIEATMWFAKGDVFRMNNLYVGVLFNIGERADDVPLAAVRLHLTQLQVSSVLVTQAGWCRLTLSNPT